MAEKGLKLLATGGVPKAVGGLAKLAGSATKPKDPSLADASKVLASAKKLHSDTERLVERAAEQQSVVYVDILIDRTASRRDMWHKIMKAQREVFADVQKVGNIALRIIHFGGDELVVSPYLSSAEAANDHMDRYSCVVGGTQFVPSLDRSLNKRDGRPLHCLVMIGDCYEEHCQRELFEYFAQECAKKNIMTFCLCDTMSVGHDADVPFEAFAKLSNGIAQPLGKGIDLSKLLAAATVFAASGEAGLKKNPELLAAAQVFLKKLAANDPRRALGSARLMLPPNP